MTTKSPTCFICDRPLGGTFLNSMTYPGANATVPAMCLRCGGRVHGLIHAVRDPLVELLKEFNWAGGDDMSDVHCVECSALRDAGDHNHENPAPHEHDCRLAIAIGAPRNPPPSEDGIVLPDDMNTGERSS